jgi:hypothetical protein
MRLPSNAQLPSRFTGFAREVWLIAGKLTFCLEEKNGGTSTNHQERDRQVQPEPIHRRRHHCPYLNDPHTLALPA